MERIKAESEDLLNFDGDYFEAAKKYYYKVIAWRETPKPYKKEN